MDSLGELRRAAAELDARKTRVAEALQRRDELIVQLALETDVTYQDIADAIGLSITAVWKVTDRAGIKRLRVQRPRAVAS